MAAARTYDRSCGSVQLLLGYLPTERSLWPYELEKKRSQYSAYKDEFLLNPSEKLRRIEESKLSRKKELTGERNGLLPRSEVTNEEHPLSFGKSSLWNQYFQESEILEQIDRDVKRTHPDKSFFSAKSNQESLRRILIIFSRLYPSVRYVQGLNEVLAPLFYVLKNDLDTSNSVRFFFHTQAKAVKQPSFVSLVFKAVAMMKSYVEHFSQSGLKKICVGWCFTIVLFDQWFHLLILFINSIIPLLELQTSAEADTFFCFVELISGFKNNYCKHLDNSLVGIRSILSKLSQLLKKHDEELWRHMEVITKVYPQYYAFRWITLLLTMEFSFNVCIHIWDAMLGDPEGPPDTLLRICCAMLILVRKRLLVGDFTANIQLLQHYPQTNIDHLLHIANRLRGTMPS
ncbi:TBC domain-containing protein C1952.17c isoform X3 [Triticum aestivum]|uniref:TBC domain-containing protein C1952.17c isoform X3 n=1 Tax=Triticum aestivum TaxID=4565 RepID=UPI001D0174DD|nr:TBC domain-containing protein C1952.17c-like isoform X3 [Triticum aestivum]